MELSTPYQRLEVNPENPLPNDIDKAVKKLAQTYFRQLKHRFQTETDPTYAAKVAIAQVHHKVSERVRRVSIINLRIVAHVLTV